MSTSLQIGNILNWIAAGLFAIIGVLNVVLIHPVPGLLYLLFVFVFLPATNTFLKKHFGFTIPPLVKIIAFVMVMWGTLGVADLMELYEASIR